jgi:hypothetical protein
MIRIDRPARTARSRPMKLAFVSAAALGAILLGLTGHGAHAAPAATAPTSPTAAARPAPHAIDPEALAALTRMGDYLRTLNTFEVAAVTSIDEEVDGQLITFDGTTTYRVRRPNAFFVEMATDRKVRQIYYDGKKVTIFSPRMKLYASFAGGPTIRETLATAKDRYDVQLPLADLFYWGTPDAPTANLITGAYIGPAKCGEAVCDQYAFQQADVDWQIWIEQGARPLPRKLVITTLLDDSQPRFSARMDWNLSPSLTDATFTFTPPPESFPIQIATAKK